jgi:hypothetical protein
MFAFLKKSKLAGEARVRIGTELHRQLKEAMEADQSSTTNRLQTSFVAGYVTSFITAGFIAQLGAAGAEEGTKYFRRICDGVLPKTLYEILQRQLAAVQLAEQLPPNPSRKSVGLQLSPEDMVRQFRSGEQAGATDAEFFSKSNASAPNRLKVFLLTPTR